MRIRDITVTNLRFAYPPGRRFRYAGGVCTGRLSTLVKVRTDEGLTGLGSVYSHPDLTRTVVENHLGPAVAGRDPLDIEGIWDLCYGLTRWYGRKGVAMSALGGIDIALWDLRGKVEGKSVSQLVGATRDAVPAYASGLLWKASPRKLAEEARRHIEHGFEAMKMRLGRSRDYDSAALIAVRDAIGDERHLMIDGNARYTLQEARAMLPRFEDAGIFWLEEPFAPEDLDLFVALLPATRGIPLAAGENEFGMQGFRELMDSGGVQVVQPDCCRCGGFTEARRIGQRAGVLGLKVAPHTWSDAVALTANMHLVASLPNALTVEFDQTGNPLIDDLLARPLKVRDGGISVPTGPGLGIELNEDTVARYEISRGTTIPAGNYSDMVFW